MKKVLLAGESWMSFTTHVKGFDSFVTTVYDSGEKWLKEALEAGGYAVTFLPNHLAMDQFPYTAAELAAYDCIILSDIGANTLLLPMEVFAKSQRKPNRAQAIKEYVLGGGALLMVGGYLTFSGIDAKGKWGHTPVQDVLPVSVLEVDDRMEHMEGIYPVVVSDHAILKGMPAGDWPHCLGYNKTIPREEAAVCVKIGEDPLIACAEYGRGRSAVFTSDCAPHWLPPEFVGWEHYNTLWQGILNWLTRK